MCIASAYRTITPTAIFVIVGTIPVDLLAAELMEIYKAKSAGNHITVHFKGDTITKWQRRWNNDNRERWAVRLILDIRPWNGRKFEEVNYYITQMYRVTDISGNVCTAFLLAKLHSFTVFPKEGK